MSWKKRENNVKPGKLPGSYTQQFVQQQYAMDNPQGRRLWPPLLGNYRERRPWLFPLAIMGFHFRQVIELHVG